MEKLLFVYNADSNLPAVLKDFFIKLFAPRRYACNLCLITYGILRMKREWKDFIESSPRETEFLHRDEFRNRYRDDTPLPAAFWLDGKTPRLLISAEEMNRLRTVNELKELVRIRVGLREA